MKRERTGILQKLIDRLSQTLTKEPAKEGKNTLCDFDELKHEIRPGDVLLIAGQSPVSRAIRNVTSSPWTHACMYIGRIHEIPEEIVRKYLFQGDPSTQLVIESLLGKGTVVSPLDEYKYDHVRICRPEGITPDDVDKMRYFLIGQLGREYHVRHAIDLGRFLFPWPILPRRWRSTLFQHHPGDVTKTVCSTLIAEAFQLVHFPILPEITENSHNDYEVKVRNVKLFTPSDFDYSPYFNIIKYPILSTTEKPTYQKLLEKEGKLK